MWAASWRGHDRSRALDRNRWPGGIAHAGIAASGVGIKAHRPT